jgi:hypothetical protein
MTTFARKQKMSTKRATVTTEQNQPRRGQPPRPADERADVYLHVRVRRDKKARWVHEAQARGMTLAALVNERMG